MRTAQVHYVIGRYDQPRRGNWIVSIPLSEAKSGENEIFRNQMVFIQMETRCKAAAEAFLKEEAGK